MARRSAPGPDPRLVDPRHRVALSKAVRAALSIEAGDYVQWSVDANGTVKLVKLTIRPLSASDRIAALRCDRHPARGLIMARMPDADHYHYGDAGATIPCRGAIQWADAGFSIKERGK